MAVALGNYVKFALHHKEANRKTDIWTVQSRVGEMTLGQVRYYPAWRRFCFFPGPGTLFDAGCLKEIEKFCEDQTSAWRDS